MRVSTIFMQTVNARISTSSDSAISSVTTMPISGPTYSAKLRMPAIGPHSGTSSSGVDAPLARRSWKVVGGLWQRRSGL